MDSHAAAARDCRIVALANKTVIYPTSACPRPTTSLSVNRGSIVSLSKPAGGPFEVGIDVIGDQGLLNMIARYTDDVETTTTSGIIQ